MNDNEQQLTAYNPQTKLVEHGNASIPGARGYQLRLQVASIAHGMMLAADAIERAKTSYRLSSVDYHRTHRWRTVPMFVAALVPSDSDEVRFVMARSVAPTLEYDNAHYRVVWNIEEMIDGQPGSGVSIGRCRVDNQVLTSIFNRLVKRYELHSYKFTENEPYAPNYNPADYARY